MLLPIKTPISFPVTLVRAVPTGLLREGTLILFDGVIYRIALEGGRGDLIPGHTVVMDFGHSGPSRCRAEVTEVEGDVVCLRARSALERPDRRIYPRVSAEILLEYRMIPQREGNERLTGRAHLQDASAAFETTDPDVDISCTGVRFYEAQPIPPGSLLMMRIQLPPEERWRGVVGEVVRVEEEDEEEFAIAVNFVDLTDDTFDQLVTFIAHRQEVLLGIA